MEEKKGFGDLNREVIETGKCTLCGGCVATCSLLDYSYLSMDMTKERPEMIENHLCPPNCGYCYYQCPRVEEPELMEGLEEIYEVVSKDEELKNAGPDGGVVTTLLAYALADAVAEGCVTAVDTGDWKPEVQVAMDKASLIKSSGTKYTPAATLTGIPVAIMNYGLWSVALAGTPCQMAGYEKMLAVGRSSHNAHNFASILRLRIGQFCKGVYSYEKLMDDFLERTHGINIKEITKLEIKDNLFHVYAGENELLSVAINEIEHYKRDGCKICKDFSGLFSDLSVGNLGSRAGTSTVIVRTDFGKEVFEYALERGFIEAKPIDKSDLDLLHRLMKEKKEAADKERRIGTYHI